MKKLWQFKFMVLGWIIVIGSNLWYWIFAIHSGDLVQIICGLVWIIFSLMLPLDGLQIDWIVEDK